MEGGRVAHLGNTYARMEYLGSLCTRHGAREVEEGPSTGLSMSRGTARSCQDDGACVSDEAFEEAEPILHLSAEAADSSDEPCGPVGAWQGALEAPGPSDEGPPPISIPARSQRREALPTVAVDLPDTIDPGPGTGPSPSWGVPPSRPQGRETLATIAVDVPEGADPFPACDPTTMRRPGAMNPSRPDPFRTIAVEVPEAGLPPVRTARREAGTADPRQTVAVDLAEECPAEDELPSDRIRMAAIRQVHANGRLVEKMRASLFR